MGLNGMKSSSSGKEVLKRKFEKKLDFYSKVKETVASLAVKKGISKKNKLRSRQKKLKAYDLSTLSEFLPGLKLVQTPQQESNFKLNCKSRRGILEKESAKLKAVLSHPVFQSDPLSAIHEHLQSTQPPTVSDSQVKRKRKTDKKKAKKKRSTASSSQSMEM